MDQGPVSQPSHEATHSIGMRKNGSGSMNRASAGYNISTDYDREKYQHEARLDGGADDDREDRKEPLIQIHAL